MYYESIHSLRGMVFTELHIKKTVIMKKFALLSTYYPNQMSFLVLLGPGEQFSPLLFKLGSQYIKDFSTQTFFKICKRVPTHVPLILGTTYHFFHWEQSNSYTRWS
jgi:hypothetical protein